MSRDRIKVLIIDDSAFARKVIREVLERDPEIEVVGYARDGLDGLEKIADLKPDVITLDLIMPDLDGIGVMKILPKENAPKVIIVSVSGSDSELAITALEMGAVDIVTKPTASPTDKLYELSKELVEKVKAAAVAIPRRIPAPVDINVTEPIAVPYNGNVKIMVLGTSTGGPQAITEIFKSLPENFPVPLIIALHIPSGYTAPLAERVSRTSQLKLVEAYDGMELVPNLAVIAPGGIHLVVENIRGRLFAKITREPIDSLYHPSVNVLFESAAKAVGKGVVGVVLTGMGSDGTNGALAIKAAGGKVLVESSSTCVVYGMPRSVLEAGASDAEASLDKMVGLMIKSLS